MRCQSISSGNKLVSRGELLGDRWGECGCELECVREKLKRKEGSQDRRGADRGEGGVISSSEFFLLREAIRGRRLSNREVERTEGLDRRGDSMGCSADSIPVEC